MYRVVETPQALPGECFLCGSSKREAFLDTNINIEFHGAVYLCQTCVEEIAAYFGMASSKRTSHLEERSEHLASQVYEFQKENERLRQLVDGFTYLSEFHSTNGDTSLPGSVSGESVSESSDDSSPAGEEQVGVGEGAPSEQSYDEGVAELHSDEPEFKLNL